MRRWLTVGLTVLLLVFAAGIGVSAAGFESVGTDEMLGTLPQVIGMKQTKGTATSITVQWKRPAGAEGYGVKIRGLGEEEFVPVTEFLSTKETVSYTVKNLLPGEQYYVRVFAGSSKDPSGTTKTILCQTLPDVSGMNFASSPKTKRVTFVWKSLPLVKDGENRQTKLADGYELYKYSLDGKLLGRYEAKEYSFYNPQIDLSKTIGVGSNFYSYRIRSYKMIDGQKSRGRLKYFYTAIQPRGKNVRQVPGSSTATIDWEKINGAYYEIYLATSQNGTYKLAKTSSAVQTTLTGLKPGTRYWLKIRAAKNIKGKVYRSSENYKVYFDAK